MTNKLLSCLIAGALGATLALAPPAFARGGGHGGGGGGHGGGWGGGMHGGGWGGGMHAGGWGGGMRAGGWGGGMRAGGWGGGARFAAAPFARANFAHAALSPRFSGVAFRNHGHFFHHRFHNRFARFAFFGAPYGYYDYADYGGCWRQAWTSYGLQWVNVCGDYGY